MKYDSEIGFALFFVSMLGGCVLLMFLFSYIRANISKDTFKYIFWDNTVLGWIWREYFTKKKAKQAPIGAPSWYVPPPSKTTAPPPPAGRPGIAGRIATNGTPGRLTAMKPYPKTYNTSSLNVPPVNNVGKPLTIQNWDRLTGMMVMVYGRKWYVTQAMHTLSGYECVLQTAGTSRNVTFCIYNDMYDSHRVSIFCGGKNILMDVGVCKDPNGLLHEVTAEFSDKFELWS